MARLSTLLRMDVPSLIITIFQKPTIYNYWRLCQCESCGLNGQIFIREKSQKGICVNSTRCHCITLTPPCYFSLSALCPSLYIYTYICMCILHSSVFLIRSTSFICNIDHKKKKKWRVQSGARRITFL